MILVTGSTGLIGSEVLRLLSHAGVPARALVRKSGRGRTLPGITWVTGDLANPESLASAFEGCTKLFLLTGNAENASELQRHAIAAARQAGVSHAVKLSAFGASPHSNSMIGKRRISLPRRLAGHSVSSTNPLTRRAHVSREAASHHGWSIACSQSQRTSAPAVRPRRSPALLPI